MWKRSLAANGTSDTIVIVISRRLGTAIAAMAR